jgi:probable F420-dependent oxidoreductase
MTRQDAGVKVYAGMDPRLPLTELAAYARRVESLGFDGLHVPETVHDAFAMALLALEHTDRLVVRTSVALAFVRSPLLTAYTAWDLARFSGGRFQLGLGTQIRQNIEERYGMPFGEPVSRMRDYVDAVQAAFTAFRTGEGIRHVGHYYRLTRLQPYFNAGPDPDIAPPPLYLGGVNREMCRLAGARADGFVTHPTNSSPRYLTELCLPYLHAGAQQAGRDLADLELVAGSPVITGRTADELQAAREHQRRMFAFLFSTPAYARTLELYDRADLTPRLQQMIRADKWSELPSLVGDDLLDELIPAATYDHLPDLLLERYAGLASGLVLPPPADPAADDAFRQVVGALRSASGSR